MIDIESVKKVSLGPEDRLVFTANDKMTKAQYDQLKSSMAEAFGIDPSRCVVVVGGVLEVIDAAEANA